jgi:uncharacterized protein YraI
MHRPAMRAGWLALPLALAVVFTTLFTCYQPVSADTDLDVGGEARVSYTNGDSIRVRSEPSYSGSVVTSVPEGWLVAVLDGPIDDGEGSQWYQVTARGQTGYMVSDYLARPGSSASSDSSSSGEVTAAAAATTTVALNLRSAASLSAAILLVMPRGASVQTTGSTQNGFSQLTYQGTTGWASSQYLSDGGSDEEPGAVIDTAWVVDGSLNLRSGPSTSNSVLLVMPNGAEVGVTGSPQNGFTPIRYNGTDGWAYSDFLSDTEPGGEEPPGEVIATAWVVDGSLNLRSGPSTSNSVLLVMPNGAEVGVTGSPQNGFTPVRYNGANGWAYSDFLSDTEPGGEEPPGEVIDTLYTTANLNLRSGPSTSNGVLRVIPEGAAVGITGSVQSGYYPVRYDGTAGYAAAQYLSSDEPGGEPEPPGEVIDTAWVIDGSLNLRSGPSMSNSVLLVMPDGAEVGVTGSPQNGYTPVRYNGADGWAYSQFLSDTEPGGEEPPPSGEEETRYTTADLNLRSGAGTSFGVLRIIPNGAAVTVTGSEQNGFFPVRYDGTTGYAAASFLTTSEPSEPPPSGGGLIVWPVRGDTWEIIQGYNGGTHQNRSETASYLYSLDIQKTSGAGATAGTAVYAPASGTVLWTNGGLLIGMGNGYGIAMFHITIDGSIGSGTQVTQGQYVGFISGPGGVGYQVTPHIDLTLWRLPNGGGSPRISTPFTGQFAVSGLELPVTGAWNTHGGTRFNP